MLKPTEVYVRVKPVDDIPQKTILAKRREQREKMLKQIGQQTIITEQKIDRLAQLTS